MLPSAGDTHQVVNSDSTLHMVNTNIPEWHKGANAPENAEWMEKIIMAVSTEFKIVCEYLITTVRNIHSHLFRVVVILSTSGMIQR